MTIRAKDPKYFMQQVDIEAELLKRATDIANKMIVAMIREQKNAPVSFVKEEQKEINLDILADKIAERMKGMRYFGETTKDDRPETTYRGGSFSLENKPAVVRLEKVEIKNEANKTTQSGETTKETLDKLSNLEI
jgi:hypothetical protein